MIGPVGGSGGWLREGFKKKNLEFSRFGLWSGAADKLRDAADTMHGVANTMRGAANVMHLRCGG